MTQPNSTAPLWPANFQGCTIHAQYLNLQGLPMSGTVTFAASPTALLDDPSNIIIVPSVYTVTLDNNGALTIVLPATDDPDINPFNWTYAVSENFPGGRKYNIKAPMNTTVWLNSVAPVPSSNGAPIYRGPKGAAGGIQTVNGKSGDIVTLNPADIGADVAGAAAAVAANTFVKANNLSDLPSSSAARGNLGLGSAALLDGSTLLTKANNLSDLNNAATARNNLGLGSAALQSLASLPLGFVGYRNNYLTAHYLDGATNFFSGMTYVGLNTVGWGARTFMVHVEATFQSASTDTGDTEFELAIGFETLGSSPPPFTGNSKTQANRMSQLSNSHYVHIKQADYGLAGRETAVLEIPLSLPEGSYRVGPIVRCVVNGSTNSQCVSDSTFIVDLGPNPPVVTLGF